MLFVRVGNYDINMDKVTHIYYVSDAVPVKIEINLTGQDGDSQSCIYLFDEEAIAFKEAWDRGIAGTTIYQVD